jgi:hypothetical protein
MERTIARAPLSTAFFAQALRMISCRDALPPLEFGILNCMKNCCYATDLPAHLSTPYRLSLGGEV